MAFSPALVDLLNISSGDDGILVPKIVPFVVGNEVALRVHLKFLVTSCIAWRFVG